MILTTHDFALTSVLNLINSVNSNTDVYYSFVGSPSGFSNPAQAEPYDNINSAVINTYRSMVFGQQLFSNNFCPVINNYSYVANTVYAMYNDADPLLLGKEFYTVVNAGSYSHIFKCLDNYNNSPSTIPPNFSDVDAADDSYTTSDGYRWKYMYSVSSTMIARFGTSNYIPFVANNNVSKYAVPGAIDVIQVVNAGNGYSNYLTGMFSISDIVLNGNTLLYALSNTASNYSQYYNGCLLYITADSLGNSAGQFRTISNYIVNSTTKYVELDSPFTAIPKNGAYYSINPQVQIVGDYTESTEAVAWAIINTSSNTIDRVDILNRGSNYKYITANVIYSSVVDVTFPAELHGVYSPPMGHGANVLSELGCKNLSISVAFAGNSSNIPSDNRYQTVGLLKNPLFANVKINVTNQSNFFIGGETLYSINRQLLGGTITANTSNNITGVGTDFVNQFDVGNYIFMTNSSFSQITTVTNIINATSLTLATNCNFNTNSVSFYYANVLGDAVITTAAPSLLYISNVSSTGFYVNNFIVGAASGATGVIGTVTRNNMIKDFSTFIQCNKYTGTVVSGTFQNNEKVIQYQPGAINPIADLFDVNISGATMTMLTTNQVGIFSLDRKAHV